MSGIFKTPSDGYVEVPLLDDERIVHQQTAAALRGKVSVTGGQLVITTQRILFRALDVGAAVNLLRQSVDFLPDGLGVLGKMVDKSLDYATAYMGSVTGAIDTSAVRSVSPGMSAAVSHPPSLIVTMANGNSVEIGILHSISSPNFWPANTTDRHEIIGLIRSLLVQNGMS